jgi:hypothetical protein
MLKINNAKTAKKSARALEKFLAKSGVDLGHGKALDAIAVLSGFKDWNSMARATSPEAMDAQLDDFELSHLEGNQDVDYGLEHATVTHTGFELRYSAEGDVVDYVRVCDPLGREVAYWVSDEWEEDPQVVMGAIIGALTRGRPELRGKPRAHSEEVLKRGETAAVSHGCGQAPEAATSSVTAVRIQDVSFEDISNVLINGVPHSLRYYDSQILGMLYEPEGDEDAESDCHHNVLELGRVDDGLEREESVTLGVLRSLTWCASSGCFKSAAGDEYVFFTEQRFSPANLSSQPAMDAADDAKANATDDLPKLYTAEVYAKEHGAVSHLGTWLGIAPNMATAREHALAELWDARLDGAGCHAVVDVEEEDEGNHAPFDVVVDGGAPVDVETLSEGISLAEQLHRTAGLRRVSLRNGDGTEVLKFTK